MNKKELINEVHQRARAQFYTRKNVEDIMNLTMNTILSKLKQGESISINNFGRIYVTERKEFTAVSNLKGHDTHVPSRKLVRFKPSRKLSKELNECN